MKRHAYKDTPLVILPNGHVVWAEQLDVNLRQRIGQVIGVLFFAVLLIGVCLLSGGPQ